MAVTDLYSEAGIASLGIIITKGWVDGLKSHKIYHVIPHFLSISIYTPLVIFSDLISYLVIGCSLNHPLGIL
jgi:hypothetical protein